MSTGQSDVKIGATYQVKVAGNLVPVKIARPHDGGGWDGTSVKTGKTIRIKTAQRLRRQLADAPHPVKQPAKASTNAKAETKRDTGERGATGGQRKAKPMSLLGAAAHLLAQSTGDPRSVSSSNGKALPAGRNPTTESSQPRPSRITPRTADTANRNVMRETRPSVHGRCSVSTDGSSNAIFEPVST